MSHILLLGAGFSRNWGGWLATEAFEYLLGHTKVIRNQHLVELLWKHQPKGGFEAALADAQAEFKRGGQSCLASLQDLQLAIADMFADMNRGYAKLYDMNFSNAVGLRVTEFLAKFDAIFTLNQDLLLERHYVPLDVSLLSGRKWDGAEFPGIRRLDDGRLLEAPNWANCKCEPRSQAEFVVSKRAQPIFKLHGSSNWENELHRAPVMVMGRGKQFDIDMSPLLSWYREQFETRIYQADVRLMSIGYGFRDDHINEMVIRAINQYGAKLFVISPEGGELARRVNPLRQAEIGQSESDLEQAFRRGLIGASRRGLRESFGADEIEHAKVMRFFDA